MCGWLARLSDSSRTGLRSSFGRRRVNDGTHASDAVCREAAFMRMCAPHSPLRLSRQRLPRREARSDTRRAGLSRTRAARRPRGLPRTLRTAHRQPHRHLPFLRRPNGRRGLMAASLPATADPALRHLMTSNLRTMLLCRIHIDMRLVRDRSRETCGLSPRQRVCHPMSPKKSSPSRPTWRPRPSKPHSRRQSRRP